MFAICSDLEGVFIPEIWVNVAEKTGIEELKLTTREMPDYDKLMQYRIDIMRANGLKLKDVQNVIAAMDVLPGASEMLDWLTKRIEPFFILSDTFIEFAKPWHAKLKFANIMCNSLVVDKDDNITGYVLRQQDGKRKVVDALHSANFKVIAFGDSYNDLNMIKAAEAGFLFRAPAKIQEENPEISLVEEYTELKQLIEKALANG